jgi:hypothetical protein
MRDAMNCSCGAVRELLGREHEENWYGGPLRFRDSRNPVRLESSKPFPRFTKVIDWRIDRFKMPFKDSRAGVSQPSAIGPEIRKCRLERGLGPD